MNQNDPFAGLPAVPGFTVSSSCARHGQPLATAPPPGHGPHRYYITVHALDVEDIEIPAESTPAFLGFTMATHTLARATIIATAETPA